MSTRERTWSKDVPIAHTRISDYPLNIRNVREDLENRVEDILAGFVNTGATNGLLLGRLLTVGTNNALTPGTGIAGAYDIYCLTTGSTMELFGKDNAGNIIQYSKAGKLMALVSGDFRSGDILLSSNTGTPAGWTEVTATYSNKFIRISTGTALTTGGTDAHTHTTDYLPDHTHTITLDQAHGVDYAATATPFWSADNGIEDTNIAATSSSTTAGSNTTSGASAVPAYVQLKMYSKN